ncbi:MFS transporter [Thermodesulfobacteriota bacterium]
MDLKNDRVFYGWWIVAAVFLISAYVSGIITFGFTAVFEPIVSEFGWSYTQVALAMSIRGLEVGLLAPLVGLLFDRWGPRKLIFWGAAVTGLGLLLFSRIHTLVAFYLAFFLIAAGNSCHIGIVPMTVTANWFHRKVSIATGIAVSGAAAGGLLVPIVTRIIDMFGWRAAMVVFGLGAWAIIFPLSLIVRHKPEPYGYLPDGDVSIDRVANRDPTSASRTESGMAVGQALKSTTFWFISLGVVCHIFSIHAVLTHVMPYLSSLGIARSTSSILASAIPLMSIIGRLGFGWFGDRYDKRRVIAASVLLAGLGMLCFGAVATAGTFFLVPFLILFGIGYGGLAPVITGLLLENFGRANLGSILGILQGVAMLGSITGQPLAGWVFDTYGSYQGAWYAFFAVAIVGVVSLLNVPSISNKMKGIELPMNH